MKIAIKTLGCRSNKYESDKLFEEARRFYDSKDNKDIYVVNTCTVTARADRKSRQLIKSLRRAHPRAKIIAFGCGITANRKMYEDMDELDYIAKDRAEVLKMLTSFRPEPCSVISSDPPKLEERRRGIEKSRSLGKLEMTNVSILSRTRVNVKIQDGCNNFCTYCIVPFARGRQRSFKSREILKEVLLREKQGFKEIVLTGINIGTWEEKKNKKILRLADLIKMILGKTKNMRVRLSSIGPQDISKKFALLLGNPRFCQHLHLSLQSGSDEILKKMNRRYDTKLFAGVCERIRHIAPKIAITTDVIVGFPGETEELFQETCRFVKKIGFAKIHIFPYSKREGTAAAKFPNQIDEKTKIKRTLVLRKISDGLSKKFRKNLIGSTETVIFEKFNRGPVLSPVEGYWSGLTGNYIRVYVNSKQNLKQKAAKVVLGKIFKNGMLAKFA